MNYSPFDFHIDMCALSGVLFKNGIEFEMRDTLFEFSEADDHEDIKKSVIPMLKRLAKIENSLNLGSKYTEI